jgi:hypothetical protein
MSFTRASIVFLFSSTIILAQAQQYVISTYAGGVPPTTPATGINLSIGFPEAIAVDSAGNAYFIALNCVFKLDQNGIVTRIAGNSLTGYSGDGGPAINAQLQLLRSTNLDRLYIPNLPITATREFAESRPTESSPQWPGTARSDFPVMADRPQVRSYRTCSAWQSTRPATCCLPIRTITGCVSSLKTGPSFRSRGMALADSPAMADQPRTRNFAFRRVW